MRHRELFIAATCVAALAAAGSAPALAANVKATPADAATASTEASSTKPPAAEAPSAPGQSKDQSKVHDEGQGQGPGQKRGQDGGRADLTIELPRQQGFAVGYQAQEGRAKIVELVPEDETVAAFTKMVTLQTAVGLGNLAPDTFLTEFANRYRQSCPNFQVTTVPLGRSLDGLRIDCTLKPGTMQIDTVFARAIDLGDDLAFVHVTLRHLAMPDEGQWARDYLASVVAK